MVKIKVDLWKTGLHGVEVGIKKKEELMARSRRFTKDMDLYGKVEVDNEDYGYVGYRRGLWEETDPLEKRLVVRLFSKDVEYLGSIDENIGRAIALTMINEEPSPAFIIAQAGIRLVYPIEKVRSRFAEPDTFLLTYINKENVLRPILIKSKRLALGSDWKVVDLNTGKEIAKVDGKILDIGGEWEIKTKEEDEILWRNLMLFAATLKFYDDIKEKLETLIKDITSTKKYIKLSRGDAGFFYNPRLRR